MITAIVLNAHKNAKNANLLNIVTNVPVTEFPHLIANAQSELSMIMANHSVHLAHLNAKHAQLMGVLNVKESDTDHQLANAQKVLSKTW
jgi:hypothetical protein